MTMQMAQADLSLKLVDVDAAIMKIEVDRAKVAETYSGIELDEKKLQLDALAQLLKDNRNAIEQTIRGGLGGMAGQPGNAVPQQGDPRIAGPAAGGLEASLLGGQALAGGQPVNPAGVV
jgi:hypothetical protein